MNLHSKTLEYEKMILSQVKKKCGNSAKFLKFALCRICAEKWTTEFPQNFSKRENLCRIFVKCLQKGEVF